MTTTGLTLLNSLLAGWDSAQTAWMVALVGAGGKTTAMQQMARQFRSPVILACSTHLGAWQVGVADQQFIIQSAAQIAQLDQLPAGVSLFTGPPAGENRLSGLDEASLVALRDLAQRSRVPLIIEADGSRQRPLKAPAPHEPVIPEWVNQVIVVAGLSGLGRAVSEDAGAVFRPERFAQLAGIPMGEVVTPQALVRVLCHPQGGLKNIPPGARRAVLLNQVDKAGQIKMVLSAVDPLFLCYDQVVVAALQQEMVYAVCQPCAAIILAAGASTRLGQPKALVEWQSRPLIRIAAESALQGGLSPVVVVTGAINQPIREALQGLPVDFINNPDWQNGQSTSVRAGLQAARSLAPHLGSVIFLLADQPFITPGLVNALRDRHRRTLAPVIAPYIGDRRSNPVLFDQVTFPMLDELQGDSGGRAIFQRYPPAALAWQDERLLVDIDTQEDLQRLKEMEAGSER